MQNLGNVRGRFRPYIDNRFIAFVVGENTSVELLFDADDFFAGFGNDLVLVAGNLHIENRRGDSGDCGILITERLDIVERIGGATRTSRFKASVDNLFKLTLAYEEVDYVLKVTIIISGISHGEFRARDILRNTVVEDDSARGGFDDSGMFRPVRQSYVTSDVNFVLTPELFGLVCHKGFVGRSVNVGFVIIGNNRFGRIAALFDEFARNDDFFDCSLRSRIDSVFVGFDNDASFGFDYVGRNKSDFLFVIEESVVFKDVFGFSFVVIFSFFLSRYGEVITTENHILRRRHNRLTVGKFKNIVGSEHKESRLCLSLDGKRNVNSHLVAVEVGVERAADERMKFDRSALDKNRLERLNGQTVKRRRAV